MGEGNGDIQSNKKMSGAYSRVVSDGEKSMKYIQNRTNWCWVGGL